jgi:hypothetical protein
MKRGGTRVGVGTRFAYDGEIVEIVEMHAVDGIPEAPAKDLCTQCRPRGRSRHRCHPSDDTRATPSWNTAQSSGAATRGTPPRGLGEAALDSVHSACARAAADGNSPGDPPGVSHASRTAACWPTRVGRGSGSVTATTGRTTGTGTGTTTCPSTTATRTPSRSTSRGRSSRDRPPDAATARESYPLAELTDLHQRMEVAATMRATSLPRRKTPMMSPAATRSKHGAAFFRS